MFVATCLFIPWESRGKLWQNNLWESHMTSKNNSELIRAHLYVQNLIIDQPHFKDPLFEFRDGFLKFDES